MIRPDSTGGDADGISKDERWRTDATAPDQMLTNRKRRGAYSKAATVALLLASAAVLPRAKAHDMSADDVTKVENKFNTAAARDSPDDRVDQGEFETYDLSMNRDDNAALR